MASTQGGMQSSGGSGWGISSCNSSTGSCWTQSEVKLCPGGIRISSGKGGSSGDDGKGQTVRSTCSFGCFLSHELLVRAEVPSCCCTLWHKPGSAYNLWAHVFLVLMRRCVVVISRRQLANRLPCLQLART